MRVLLLFLLLLAGAGAYLFDQWLAPQLRGPQRVGTALVSLAQEKGSVEKQGFAVTGASILEEDDARVVIRIAYEGNDPAWGLNVCGDVQENSMAGPWGCQPRVLQAAQGSADIAFVLVQAETGKARAHECSDSLSFSVYGRDGSVFYRHRYALQKVWHPKPGMWSWFRFRHDGCPSRDGRSTQLQAETPALS